MKDNDVLKSCAFIIDAKGEVISCGKNRNALELERDYDNAYPQDAPHRSVQLQVAGTLPDGAIMPKYKVGDRVLVKGTEVYRVTKVRIVYAIDSLEGKYGCGDVGESALSPAPDVEFETYWNDEQGWKTEIPKGHAYLIWQAAKAK